MSLPQSRRISLSTGLRYHYLEWGGDDVTLDHTVILIHGFLDLSWTWEAVAAAGLDRKFHLIAPDLRGHGDSDRVGAGGYYHFMDYLADLADLIEQVGRNKVSLVGHSMGCLLYTSIRIIDFGIAKMAAEDREVQDFHTRTGTMIGTPVYMAPDPRPVRVEVEVRGTGSFYMGTGLSLIHI